MSDGKYIGGRIVGGHSLHEAHDPSKCPSKFGRSPECGIARCVDCCGVTGERDILECSKCGKQWTVRCSFDEDFS